MACYCHISMLCLVSSNLHMLGYPRLAKLAILFFYRLDYFHIQSAGGNLFP